MTFNAARHDEAAGHFEDFALKYGNEVAEDMFQRICEVAYAQNGQKERKEEGVTISSIHRHNAINMTFTGTVMMPDGVEYGFVIDDGDWNGTQVQEWGLAEDVGGYEPPRPTFWMLFPRDAQTLRVERKAMWGVYLAWRKEGWFLDLERGYNYDRHFAPGCKTNTFYQDKASRRGLVWETEEHVAAFIARPDSDFEGLPTTAELVAAWGEFSA